MALIRKFNRATRKMIRNKEGSTAVEFSIVVLPFLAIIFSTFELAWFNFVSATLDAATINISREIRTGQITNNVSFDPDEFFDEEVCSRLSLFGDCDTNLIAEVKVFNSFNELANDNSPVLCADSQPQDLASLQVNPGTELDIVRVRICLLYRTLNPAIGINLANAGSNQRRLTATYLFRNEPFSTTSGGTAGGATTSGSNSQ